MSDQQHERWRRAQEHERQYWQERGDVPKIIARRKPHYEAAMTRLTEMLPDDAVVADVGSGPTCWARFLPGTKVYVDPLMGSYVERWGGELPEGHPIAATGEALPLRSDSFDLVLSLNAIDHCADPEAVIRECARVAKPGGLIAISVYVHPRLRAVLRKIRETLGFASAPHPFSFTRETVPGLLEGCGLAIVDVIDLGAISFRTRSKFLQRTEPMFLARAASS